jgi:hypothetical protein
MSHQPAIAGYEGAQMDGPDAPLIRFAPERRYKYWPYSAMFLVVWAWLLWSMGAFEHETSAQRLERALVALAVTGIFPLCAVWYLLLPFRRAALEVRPEGLRIVPVGGCGATTIPWADIARVERRARRGPDDLQFTLRSGNTAMLGRGGRLSKGLFDGTLAELLRAIRDVAPAGGYALEGHRLDIRHMGGEVWRVVPQKTRS